MRALIILFCTTVFSFNSVNIMSQNAKIKIEANVEMTVNQVFELIKIQTDYTFIYQENLFSNAPLVSLKKGTMRANKLLEKSLAFGNYEYTLTGDKLILLSEIIVQQTITGLVSDANGEPLPGVNVFVGAKGSSIVRGTATDFEGKYNVSGVKGEVIKFSYLGYKTQEFIIENQKTLNVILEEDEAELNEVLVVGYGKVDREKVGSSVAQIEATEIEKRSVGLLNIEHSLGGQLKGVQVTQSSGAIGSETTFNIRGITSPFGGTRNQPLFVIDGVPFFTDPIVANRSPWAYVENPLLAIEPDNIESVSVLKDAAATAIYGSRGANGVIIITTKRGKKSTATRINIKATTSFSNPIKTHDVLDLAGYKKLQEMIANNTIDAHNNGGKTRIGGYRVATSVMDPVSRQYLDSSYDAFFGETIPVFGNANTDWQDEIYRNNAVSTQLNFDISGGNENTTYLVAFSRSDINSLMINSEYKRYGMRVAVDSDLKDWLKVGTTLNYNGSKNNTGQEVAAGSYSTDDSALTRPDYPVYDAEGNLKRLPWNIVGLSSVGNMFTYGRVPNPLAKMEHSVDRNSTNFTGNIYAEIKPIEGLTIRGDVNAGIFDTDTHRFTPVRSKDIYAPRFGIETKNSLMNGFVSVKSFSTNLQVSYNKTFGEHSVNAMIGQAFDRYFNDNISFSFSDTPDDYVLTNSTSANEFTDARGGKNESGIDSYFSRIQYGFDDRYNFTFNLRTDISTKFGPGNNRAWYPSAAINWNITNEKFMENSELFDKMALRASYGVTGSSNVGDFNFLQFFEVGTGDQGQYRGQPAINPSTTFPNIGIGWESTSEWNLGLDFTLFSSRVYGSFDFYKRVTDNIITPTPIFVETGQPTFTSNLAEISNKGFELEIGADIIKSDNLDWSINFIYAENVGIVENVTNSNLSPPLFKLYQEGEKIGNIFGYHVEGIFQSQEEVDALNALSPNGYYYNSYTTAGDFKYQDADGDGRITTGSDYVKIGNSQPDFFGGFSTNLRYHNFSLFAGFQYAVGVDRNYVLARDLLYNNFDFSNMSPEALDMWSPTNTDSKISSLRWGYYGNDTASDAIVYDASYLRLKAVTLNYNLPSKYLKGFMSSLDIFVAATNLLTITDYPGLDPESSNAKSLLGRGEDNSTHPFEKTITFGVKIGL